MPEYLAPGVYVEEVDTGSKPIEGVSTSTAGLVGMTKRGPTSGLPVLATSFADFKRKFGGYFDFGPTFIGHNYLPYAVEGFFTNGGKRVYIMRVKGQNATKASTTAKGGLVTRLKADAAINQTKLKLSTLRGIHDGSTLKLRMIKESVAYESNDLTVATNGINRSTGEITVTSNITITPAGPIVFDYRYTIVFTDLAAINANGEPTALATPLSPRPDTFNIEAKDEGSWGKDIVIQAFHESAARAEYEPPIINSDDDDNKVRLKSTAGFYANAWVEIDRGKTKIYRRIKSVDGKVLTLYGSTLADPTPELPAPNDVTIFSTCEFKLVVSYDEEVEQFSGLTIKNNPGRYYVDIINKGSKLISVPEPSVQPPDDQTHPFLFPSGGDGIRILLDSGGSDGTSISDDDYKGVDNGPGKRTGIQALVDIDEISIVAVPGITTQVVQDALIAHCELLKDRFAILDPKPKNGNAPPDLEDIKAQRKLFDTKYTAIYYPRILVRDPLTKKDIPIPPSGHIAGIYARSDIERGVHKAPANEVIRGITNLELTINKGEHDILNPFPVNINVLRDFRSGGRGYRVWGARCITSDPDWKYINVRRLFIFVEESIEEGTQWVVFEPNDEPTWARVRRSVTNFLTNVWRDGALQGRKPEEAFFVKCDRTTMTQTDIDNGKLIMVIGIAPVKPAEFVIFRIGQWSGGSEVEEL